MSVFLLCFMATLVYPLASSNTVNVCEKKYFEVEIYEEPDFLQEMIYGLSKGRCGVLKVQLCPPEMSYISPQSQYFDTEYKHWAVNNSQNLSSNSSLEYKIRRSSEKIREEKNETSPSIQLPAEILALFELFNAVSQRYDI